MGLLEAVPNVSEGRRPEVIARLAAAAAAATGARLLQHSADPDHNRSVFTLAGEPAALEEALLALAATAVEAIDLTRHEGVHPRIGALDVVPFVPLAGAAMTEAVAAARRFGARLAERFALPVFLYEAAASAAHRRNLAALRRGGSAGLAARLTDPAWRPDFGPPRLHPTAGACAVGARDLLIAFNAVLDVSDLAVAREVARRVREASGGLPAVKALGFPLARRGRAQVSMNLVDFRRTAPAAALAAVRREAAALGAGVEAVEVVGLVPRAACAGAEADPLLAAALTGEVVLEEQMRRHGLAGGA